jgi:hypothetical protein
MKKFGGKEKMYTFAIPNDEKQRLRPQIPE